MGILKDKGVVVSDCASSALFEGLFPGFDFTTLPYTDPKDYITQYYDAYKATGAHNATMNGYIFEYIISTLFIREGILPFYIQACVQHVPNTIFDMILINEKMIVSISLKTSLRERIKQADLEAYALKNVYRKCKCYLFSMYDPSCPNAITNANTKIQNDEAFGLDLVVDCTTDAINDAIAEIKALTYRRSVMLPEIHNQNSNTSDNQVRCVM